MLFLSCTSRTIYKKPKNLIDREKMIAIWTDLYIATGARLVKTKTLRNKINYVPLVLESHNIDSLQFSESNIYYTSRIDEYEKMFEEVQNRLKELKKTYQPESKKDTLLIREPVDTDSLKKKRPIRKLLQEKAKN